LTPPEVVGGRGLREALAGAFGECSRQYFGCHPGYLSTAA